jgi:hypothetical protein
MSEEINKAMQQAENENIKKIEASIKKIEDKNSKFLFVMPETDNPSATVYEVFFHATVVKKMGYPVVVLTEKGDYKPPKWIEKELTDHYFISMADPKLMVGPEDIMVIPEIFSNVMEQTKNLPCKRIGLLQSVDHMLNALIPGTSWASFGVNDIITTSQTLKECIETYYGVNMFNVKTYRIGIPDYFHKSEIPQKPIISVVGRNANEISKFVKLFYSRYPQYNWVTFDPMLTRSKPPQTMRRIDFAKRLRENFAAIWIDRIASFGTFPLECMKSGTIPIGLKPDIMPEYLVQRNEEGNVDGVVEGGGVWTNNYYDLPILTGDVLVKYIDDSINDELYESMDKIVAEYSPEHSENDLIKIYNDIISERKAWLSDSITTKNNEETPKQ